jgi:transposase-like protein
MKEIYNAEDADKARAAITAVERDYGAKFPKAVAKIVDDADVCWSSTTTRRSIGSICARRTPSNLLSRQCV